MSCSLSPPGRAPGRQTTALSLRGSAQYLPTAPLEGGGPLREASLLGLLHSQTSTHAEVCKCGLL